MISRGIIIGKIIDDLTTLKLQVETRNKLGQTDLSKYCEDFFKNLLNIVFNLNLTNLNQNRNNYPGLDLGDVKNKVAYQITSQKESIKVTETLKKITQDDSNFYKIIKIFIIGKKQKTYTITKTKNTNTFNECKDIIDIDELMTIHNLFQKEFMNIKIELEPVDEDGNYQSSYFNIIEKKPSSPPKNAKKYICEEEEEEEFENIINLYEKLSSVPRVTREILAVISEKGNQEKEQFDILVQKLRNYMKISDDELLSEINILEDEHLLYVENDNVGGNSGERQDNFIKIDTDLGMLFGWLLEKKLSIRTLLNKMDFSVLDE